MTKNTLNALSLVTLTLLAASCGNDPRPGKPADAGMKPADAAPDAGLPDGGLPDLSLFKQVICPEQLPATLVSPSGLHQAVIPANETDPSGRLVSGIRNCTEVSGILALGVNETDPTGRLLQQPGQAPGVVKDTFAIVAKDTITGEQLTTLKHDRKTLGRAQPKTLMGSTFTVVPFEFELNSDNKVVTVAHSTATGPQYLVDTDPTVSATFTLAGNVATMTAAATDENNQTLGLTFSFDEAGTPLTATPTGTTGNKFEVTLAPGIHSLTVRVRDPNYDSATPTLNTASTMVTINVASMPDGGAGMGGAGMGGMGGAGMGGMGGAGMSGHGGAGMGGAGMGGSNMCLPDPCHGHSSSCNTSSGACTCLPAFAGNATCGACAAGFIGYPNCVDDPCLPDPCNGHATSCTPGAGTAFTCACSAPFAGNSTCSACGAGFVGTYPNCTPAGCGNGVIEPPMEQCDNGTANSNTGTCTLACQNARCGDNFTQPGESCDDGNTVTEGCTTYAGSCTICNSSCQSQVVQGPSCGDGTINGPEVCDSGASNGVACTASYGSSCNYCSSTCATITVQGPRCGDSTVNGGGETCDSGASNGVVCTAGYGSSCSYCSSSCSTITVQGPRCGDGVINGGGETCDNGGSNGASPAACSTSCRWNPPEITIPAMPLDCSGGPNPGFCAAGGAPYNFTFMSINAVRYTASVRKISGSGTVASISPMAGTITSSSTVLTFTTGNGTNNVMEVTITGFGPDDQQDVKIVNITQD